MIEAVIGLAPNLFYGTQLAGCVVILRRKKPAERKNKVLIVDASALFRKGRAQSWSQGIASSLRNLPSTHDEPWGKTILTLRRSRRWRSPPITICPES